MNSEGKFRSIRLQCIIVATISLWICTAITSRAQAPTSMNAFCKQGRWISDSRKCAATPNSQSCRDLNIIDISMNDGALVAHYSRLSSAFRKNKVRKGAKYFHMRGRGMTISGQITSYYVRRGSCEDNMYSKTYNAKGEYSFRFRGIRLITRNKLNQLDFRQCRWSPKTKQSKHTWYRIPSKLPALLTKNVKLTVCLKKKADMINHEFFCRTGKKITVTEGVLTTAMQAKRMTRKLIKYHRERVPRRCGLAFRNWGRRLDWKKRRMSAAARLRVSTREIRNSDNCSSGNAKRKLPKRVATALRDRVYFDRSYKRGRSTLAKEIRVVFQRMKRSKRFRNRSYRQSRPALERAVKRKIADQMEKSRYVSRHLTKKAIDLRTEDLSDRELCILAKVIRNQGGSVLDETLKPGCVRTCGRSRNRDSACKTRLRSGKQHFHVRFYSCK